MSSGDDSRTTARYRRALAAILALGLLLRLALSLMLPPGYDESYYLFYGQNPSLSYFDHPLAVAVWAGLGLALPGLAQADPVQALRLPGLFSYSAALLLLAEASRRWFGRRAALIAAVLGSVSPLLFVCGGLLLLPDSPLILLLSLLLWWLSRHPLHAERRAGESLRFGLILGLLTLCKYQALLLILTLLLLRLNDSLRRRQLRWRDTALVAIGWLAVSWPLWLWNLNHGWRSFGFHAARTGGDPGFNGAGPPLFLLSQLALLFPTIGVLLLLALLQPAPQPAAARSGDSGAGIAGEGAREASRLLRTLALPQLLVFLLLAGRMQVLMSWLLPAWWLLLPPAAAWLAAIELRRRPLLRALAALTVVAGPVLSAVAAAHVRWGIGSALVPPAVDTSGELMTPWQLRQALQTNPRVWRALQQAEEIASNRYELPGFLALALRGHSRARYTSYSCDDRGFEAWRSRLPRGMHRGVVFAVIGAPYDDLASLQRADSLNPWRFGPLVPLGRVRVLRSGQTAALLEFASYDPALLTRRSAAEEARLCAARKARR